MPVISLSIFAIILGAFGVVAVIVIIVAFWSGVGLNELRETLKYRPSKQNERLMDDLDNPNGSYRMVRRRWSWRKFRRVEVPSLNDQLTSRHH